MNNQPTKILIAGTNAEAWVVAALYAKSLENCTVEVLGANNGDCVTYNLAPENLQLLQHLGITEQSFLKQTAGCFNLGTHYQDWVKRDHSYMQSFGSHGGAMDNVAFQHYVIKQHQSGKAINYEDYSLSCRAARDNKFARPKPNNQSILATLNYALTVNGQSLIDSLQTYAADFGVKSINSNIQEVLIGEDSEIQQVVDEQGQAHVADIYLDCSRSKRALISALPGFDIKTLESDFKTDSVIQWQSPRPSELKNHAVITAKENGWLREVSDQKQCFMEYYFNSKTETTENALKLCRENGMADSNYTTLSSKPSIIESPWLANCVALGTASGYLEPLDVSSLHGLITDAMRLLELFPRSANWGSQRYEYNRKTLAWYNNACYMNLHRYLALNDNSAVSLSNTSAMPEAVTRKRELFMDNGQIAFMEDEPFQAIYQVSMFLGLENWPNAHDPLVDNFDVQRLDKRFADMLQDIDKVLAFMPAHEDFLARDTAG